MRDMPQRTLALAVAGLVAGLVAAVVPDALAFHKNGADIGEGRKVYNVTCVACHGANGKGTVPGAPDFTKRDGRLTKTDEDLFRNTKHGFRSAGSPMAMPRKGGNPELKDEDIENVLGYMHKAFGSN